MLLRRLKRTLWKRATASVRLLPGSRPTYISADASQRRFTIMPSRKGRSNTPLLAWGSLQLRFNPHSLFRKPRALSLEHASPWCRECQQRLLFRLRFGVFASRRLSERRVGVAPSPRRGRVCISSAGNEHRVPRTTPAIGAGERRRPFLQLCVLLRRCVRHPEPNVRTHSQTNRDKEAPTRDFLWMAKKRAAARSGERESVHSLSFNSRATCEQRTVSEATDTSPLRLVRGNEEGRTAFDPTSIAGTQLSGIVFPSLPSDDCFAADNDASLVAQTLP